jgi:hypothetical protein
LDNSTSSFATSLEIILRYTSSTENILVSKVLSCQITNRESRKDNFSSSSNDLVKLVIDQFPFGINNLLEIFRIAKSDLSTVFFSLKLKFNVKSKNFGIVK